MNDDQLLEEATHLGIEPARAYVEMTPRMRSMAKAQAVKRLKVEARRLKVNPDRWVELSPEERAVERKSLSNGDPPYVPREGDEEDEDSDDAVLHVYTARDSVPAIEPDPKKRDGMTIGLIDEIEKPPDHIGDSRSADPRTLQDIYSRWPIGDGQHYIRVERTQPKAFGGVACAGYLGDIKEPFSERKFQQYFGGREFELTLFGPDPRGRHDDLTGGPVIKALTKGFKITVPILPPNLAVLPAMETNQDAKEKAEMTQSFNPFAPAQMPMMQQPMTTAEATVHKTNSDLVTNVLRMQQEEVQSLRKRTEGEGGMGIKEVLSYTGKTQGDLLAAARADADARQRILEAQLAEERSANRATREKLEQLTGKSDGSTIELVKALGGATGERDNNRQQFYEQQLASVRTTYETQLDSLRRSHVDALGAIKEMRSEEQKAAEARYRDLDGEYRRRMDDLQRKSDENEKRLKDEIDRVRKEERDLADKRTNDTKERYEDRLKDLDRAHDRELKSLRENMETRMHTSVTTKDFELTTLRSKVDETKQQLEEARHEAEEASDPVKAKEKADRIATTFGYAKEDNAPKTSSERFWAMAGGGVGQALQNIDKWAPDLLATIRGQAPQPRPGQQFMQAPQLAPGQPQAGQQQQAQPQAPQQPQRRRGVAWAAAGQEPRPPVNAPSSPMGFQPDTPQPAQQPDAAPPPAPLEQAAQAVAPQQQGQPQQPERQGPPNPFGSVFDDNAVQGFMQNLDGAINIGMTSGDFAQQFFNRYPQQAATLVRTFTTKQVIDYVLAVPGGDMSAIARRDGAKFLDELWAGIKKLAKNQASAQQAQPQASPA